MAASDRAALDLLARHKWALADEELARQTQGGSRDSATALLERCEALMHHLIGRWARKDCPELAPSVRQEVTDELRSRGLDPQRMSFTATLKILRCRLPECPAGRRGRSRWYRDLVAEIAEEVLPERRDRVNPRVIKRKMSNWKKKRPEHRHYPQPTQGFAESIVMRR